MRRSAPVGILLCIFLLSACGPQGPAPAPSEATATQTAGAVTSSADWEPHESISFPSYTPEEQAAWREQWLGSMAADLSLTDPPPVDLVRWTTSRSDYVSSTAECMTASGFPMVVEDAGEPTSYYDPPVPADQQSAVNVAYFQCNSQYTPVPVLMTDWNEGQLGMVYDYWTEAYIPCLETHGVSISTPPPPSRATFISTFFDAETERWWAPDNVPMQWSPEELAQLGAACPTLPASRHFYGTE